MTGTHQVRSPSRSSRLGEKRLGRTRRPAVTVVDGVQMSCQELDDDLALIRFVCPPPRRRRRARARET
jgi:hypothetical protein